MTSTPVERIRLIATDLDGTLLDSAGQVGARARQAIAAARETGVELAFLTARPLPDATALLAAGGLSGFLAASNGAVICDPSGSVLSRSPFGPEYEFVPRLRALGVALGVVTERKVVLDDRFPDDLGQEWQALTSPRLVDDLLASGRALKILAACAHRSSAELALAVNEALGDRVRVTYSTHRFVEITPRGIDKGHALELIAGFAGVAPREVACVGDMPNDITMLARSGLAVAVANADPSVLAIAQLVVPSNNDGGVAELIEAITTARSGIAEGKLNAD